MRLGKGRDASRDVTADPAQNDKRNTRLKTLLDICDELDCQPGDIIRRVSEKELEELIVERAKNVVRQMRDGGGNEVSLPTSVFAVDLSDE